MKENFGDSKGCFVAGVRTEESPNRTSALTMGETYKGRTWGKKFSNKNQFTFYPIYDWTYSDVWKSIHDNGWSYNEVYNKMYQYGVPVLKMRVSSLHHESSVQSLFFLQEFEPDNYNKMVKRLSGVDTAGKMSYDNFYCPKEVPFMFNGWKDYRDYLVENLITHEEHRKGFQKKFEEMEFMLPFFGERLYRTQINSVMTNDFGFWKLSAMVVPKKYYNEFKAERQRLKDERKNKEVSSGD